MLIEGMSGGRIAIDLSTIEDLADGDPQVIAELIAMFVRHTGDAIAQVRAAVEAADFAQTARVAHTCIGFTASLGISDLVPTLRELERASKAGHREDVARCLARWECEFEQARRALEHRIKAGS